ncbi:hypothetical protein ACQCX2_10605 [Propionibacteriaceae bacterium Y1700]|uniref:hypothetical protein n=1 Tax=Microlunatus sp. Y1700 TaxID=3418487 RepID=UPI003DA6E8E8
MAARVDRVASSSFGTKVDNCRDVKKLSLVGMRVLAVIVVLAGRMTVIRRQIGPFRNNNAQSHPLSGQRVARR